MKQIFVIFCSLVSVNAFAAGGNIGVVDDRQYGSLQDPIYSAVGAFRANGYSCTAGFIDKNLIITNRHCAVMCNPASVCKIRFWNGSEYVESPISKVVAMPRSFTTLDGNDWAILSTELPNPNFKTLAQNSAPGPINRGGFGALRVIENSELQPLKELFIQTYQQYNVECQSASTPTDCVFKHFDQAVKNAGFKPLLGDSNNFKVQKCNINGDHPSSTRALSTSCDSASGDSGAPLLRGSNIVGLNNAGPHGFIKGNEEYGAIAVKTENFYGVAQKAIADAARQPTTTNIAQSPATKLSETNSTAPVTTIQNRPGQPTASSNSNQESKTATQSSEPDQPTIVTNPDQIQQIINEEIMSMECD